jgi:hypothetical protein
MLDICMILWNRFVKRHWGAAGMIFWLTWAGILLIVLALAGFAHWYFLALDSAQGSTNEISHTKSSRQAQPDATPITPRIIPPLVSTVSPTTKAIAPSPLDTQTPVTKGPAATKVTPQPTPVVASHAASPKPTPKSRATPITGTPTVGSTADPMPVPSVAPSSIPSATPTP